MPDVRTGQSTGFGRRLREIRRAAGLSQAALADLAGVTRNTVGNVEGNWSEPSWPLALAFARALGVGVEAFVSPPEESTHSALP